MKPRGCREIAWGLIYEKCPESSSCLCLSFWRACLLMGPEKYCCCWENRPAGDRARTVNIPRLPSARCTGWAFPSTMEGELQVINWASWLFVCLFLTYRVKNIPCFLPESILSGAMTGQAILYLSSPQAQHSENSGELICAFVHSLCSAWFSFLRPKMFWPYDWWLISFFLNPPDISSISVAPDVMLGQNWMIQHTPFWEGSRRVS